ncbi:MAG TPA: ketoacyl-ACP synthase III [Acidobacteriaceae bacterium]|jgi:3-oxoacyl-[acyl-carrier-protein] synthase-3
MAYLRSFGCSVPPARVGNDALAARTGREAALIEKTTGILERRYAAADVSVVDLAVDAANECLRNAGITAQDLGLLLVSSGSMERAFPGPASSVAARLGLTGTPAIDLPIASAGSLIGVALAADLAERYGNVLVVASEIMSRRISDADADTAILFGDGAGACLVSRDSGIARITDYALYTDGNSAEALQLPFGGALQMKGLDVIMHASRKVPRAIAGLLEKYSMPAGDVGVYLMHQANANLLRKIAAALKVPDNRFFSNIEHYGNTSSASLLIAAAEWWSTCSKPLTTPIVMAAFGAGFQWGALLAQP